jgi:hypothetical protein
MNGLNDTVNFRLGNHSGYSLLHEYSVNAAVVGEQLYCDPGRSRLRVLELKSFEIPRLNPEDAGTRFGHGNCLYHEKHLLGYGLLARNEWRYV